MEPNSGGYMCYSGHQRVSKLPCLDEMWRLQTMLWQQQPSQQVMQHVLGHAHSLDGMTPAMQEVLVHLLHNELIQVVPPNISYIARLVKQAVTAAEDHHQELREALLKLHTTLLVDDGKEEASQWRYKTFYYSDSPSWCQLQQLQLQQCRNIQQAMLCVDSSCPPSVLSSGGGHAQPCMQQCTARWIIPAHLRHQLQQRQILMRQLLLPLQQVACTADIGAQQTSSSSIQIPLQFSPDCHNATTLCTSGQADHCLLSSSQQNISGDALGRSPSKGLITICSSDNMFEGSTGCHMWDACFLLAEFVLNHQYIFAGRRVMEIGCGPGLVATCLCRSGPDNLLLTDGDPQTLINCLSNLSLNGHFNATLLGSWQDAQGFVEPQTPLAKSQRGKQPQVLACALDWHEDVPGLTADVIVGSDICYDPDAVPILVRLLKQLLIPFAPSSVIRSQGKQPAASNTEVCGSQIQIDDAAAQQRSAAAGGGGAAGEGGGCCAGPALQSPLCASLGCVATCSTADELTADAPGAVDADEVTAAQGTAAAPVAFIAITRRQDTTLQLFLDKCAEAQLFVQEISKYPETWLQHQSVVGPNSHTTGACSSSHIYHASDSVAVDDHCSGACCAVDACLSAHMLNAKLGKADRSAARFQELPPLQAAAGREQYVLHKVTRML